MYFAMYESNKGRVSCGISTAATYDKAMETILE